ncbi:MAG: DUF4474 domain-containing protein [Lachnospiraceae bacterium]|nr:DUF4474 domain-containing protein [Lachnospiraceae bacterium]
MESFFPYRTYLPLVLLTGIILLISCFIIWGYYKRKRIIHQISRMSTYDKAARINDISVPLGFSYVCGADIFTSTLDAWQREFGYHMLFDKLAWRFQMIFDCEPIYFYYDNKTWLIEFWKGQYGINTGAEIGIYYADGIIEKENLSSTLFQCATDESMLPFSFTLRRLDESIVSIKQKHWWLTAFDTGIFSSPASLTMQIGIAFPNISMQHAFLQGMLDADYSISDIHICGLHVSFTFDKPHFSPSWGGPFIRFCRRIRIWLAQRWNKLLCKLFLWFTKPFATTLDRMLLLEMQIPRIFRKCFRIRKYKKYQKRFTH